MTLEEIIKLIDAGYTKADIEKMQAPAAEVKQPEAKNEKQEKPAEKPEEKKPESEPVKDTASEAMLQELRDLKKAVYAMNIMNTEQPEQRETVDDILAKALKEG